MNNKTERVKCKGTLEILGRSRERGTPATSGPEIWLPVTNLSVLSDKGLIYNIGFFENIPQEYNGKRVIVNEYQEDKGNGVIIIKYQLRMKGHLIPIVSREKMFLEKKS